jgi:sulfite exporter TauE/SafE
MTYVVAFVGGLIGSLHCLGMCGGFPLALARSRAGSRPQILYNLGRVSSLLFLGVTSGALGATVLALGQPLPLRRILAAGAGLWMVAIGLERPGILPPVGVRLGAIVARGLGRPLRAAIALPSAATRGAVTTDVDDRDTRPNPSSSRPTSARGSLRWPEPVSSLGSIS